VEELLLISSYCLGIAFAIQLIFPVSRNQDPAKAPRRRTKPRRQKIQPNIYNHLKISTPETLLQDKPSSTRTFNMKPQTLPATLLVLLLGAQLHAADTGHLRYAYEAFDADGWWIASGHQSITVLSPNKEGYLSLVARSDLNRSDPQQSHFRMRGDFMHGRIEDDSIKLVPSFFTHSGYISLFGRFTRSQFGAFEGHWQHDHNQDGYGHFHAWPVGETARRYGRHQGQ